MNAHDLEMASHAVKAVLADAVNDCENHFAALLDEIEDLRSTIATLEQSLEDLPWDHDAAVRAHQHLYEWNDPVNGRYWLEKALGMVA